MSSRISLREIGVGEGRVIARAVGRDAVAQRAEEVLVASSCRCRSRGPASGSAHRCRRRACRSACRRRRALPDRRYGSLRNRRPPPAPCRGRSSPADGSAASAAECTAQNEARPRIAAEAATGLLHPSPCPAHYRGVTPFRAKPFARHKSKWLARASRARNCDLCRARLPSAEICGAPGEKTDIDWF